MQAQGHQGREGLGRTSADVLARFLDVNPMSMQAAEPVFGDLLQALVTESLDELRELMRELKRHQGARAQFLPLPLWRLLQARDRLPPIRTTGFDP